MDLQSLAKIDFGLRMNKKKNEAKKERKWAYLQIDSF